LIEHAFLIFFLVRLHLHQFTKCVQVFIFTFFHSGCWYTLHHALRTKSLFFMLFIVCFLF
jgi:hypothetical protein